MYKYLFLILVIVISIYGYHLTAISLEDFTILETNYQIDDLIKMAENKKKEKMLVTYTIVEGDTFVKVMELYSISYEESNLILGISNSLIDFTNIRAGKDIRFYLGDGGVDYFEYDIDEERMVRVSRSHTGFVVESLDIEYEESLVTASALVTSSLFAAASSVGVEDAVILRMADILAWSIDFSTAIRGGDSFRILYKKRTRDGVPAPAGEILAVQYVNNEREFNGYRYADSSRKTVFYNEKGESLVKQFLKAPLKFSRITSGYTGKRFHPVIGKDTAHRAIDYAAPLGTPINSVGDGTITFAGWSTGYGNFIKIKHNGTYSTHYAHLSAIAKGVKTGSRVVQGQVIGFVGSTGWSTGPHLHYEIAKNGNLVNPLTIELPAGDPVSPENKEDFFQKQQALHMTMMSGL